MNEPDLIETRYPSVKSAYEIALKSYDWAIQRSDAVDASIDKLLAWISSLTVAIVSIISTSTTAAVKFNSLWFYYAVAFAGLAILVGLAARIFGSLILPAPKELYAHWTHYTPWEFQKNMLYDAGKHYERNRAFVNWKGAAMTVMTVLLLLEVTSMMMWIIAS